MTLEDFKYYVVELSESSFKGSDKYVCILCSWIKFREIADGEVLIKYPMEDKSITKRRVKNKEESSDDWPIFSAGIKLGTNSYKEATNYIKILKKISKQESKKLVEGVPSTSSQTSETNVQTISAVLSDNVKPVSDPTSEQEVTASKECQEETKDENSPPKTKRYFTRLTSKMSSQANTVSVDQTVENNSSETNSCSKEIVKYNPQQDLVKNCEEFTDDFILRQALQDVLGDDYKEKIGMLYDEYRKRYTMFKMLCHDALEHCKVLKELKTISDNGNDSQEVAPNKKKELPRSGIQNNDDDNDDDDDMNVTEDGNNIKSINNNPSNKIRGQARKFILPPEYDPEDSTWTLKHREYKEGLVELIPNSHIYVDATQLNNCKRNSKDSKIFARMLLLEVFRKSALSICSLTGKKANAFELTGTIARPGLDEHARNVLLNFVEQYAIDQKWVHWDRPTILSSLRNKLQEMRGKYG